MSLTHRLAAVLAGAVISLANPGLAAVPATSPGVHALLDVPYVAQTQELCGAAAVAMVLGYWGEPNVSTQDFSALVDAQQKGILTGALASAVRSRGWQAVVGSGGPGGVVADDPARIGIRSQLDRGRPLIALIEVAPAINHYVVIVGSTDKEVVVHDPARTPFLVLSWTEFDRASAAGGRWTMLVLPPQGYLAVGDGGPNVPTTAGLAGVVVRTPCRALVEAGVRSALSRDASGAERNLVVATELCSEDPTSWRELAGWRFSQSRWSEAEDLARSAVRLAPDDAYGWQLLATSRYMQGDLTGALDAWNHAGEPRIERIDVQGAERTRQSVIIRTAGLRPRQVLTSERLGRTRRRMGDLPVAPNARIQYEPLDGGLANVDLVIKEKRVVPSGWGALSTIGARALVLHELRGEVAGPLGAGELLTAMWRWTAGRPRVTVALALPSPEWLPGVISLDGLWERQTYDATPGSADATIRREGRRRAGLHVADWSTSWLKWQIGATVDRLRQYNDLNPNRFDPRNYLAADAVLDVRLASDRFAAQASGGWWTPFAGGDRFATGGLLAAWRSSNVTTVPYWSAVTEIAIANEAAPLALWQGAGTGSARGGLLRAHPLLESNVLTGPLFGRQVMRGSVEYARPLIHMKAGGLLIAGFADAAQASRRLNGLSRSPLFIDAGVGLRAHTPGAGGAIRIDVAHGLRGGGTTLSAGWGGAWPR